MTSPEQLRAEAAEHDTKSQELRKQARQIELDALAAKPVDERLIYAAYARCPCGAGMAYDPAAESGATIHGYWDCSAILLGKADDKVKHEARLPFAFYEIKSENQPSANGATTRPKPAHVA
jgi:hypothetical protein